MNINNNKNINNNITKCQHIPVEKCICHFGSQQKKYY